MIGLKSENEDDRTVIQIDANVSITRKNIDFNITHND